MKVVVVVVTVKITCCNPISGFVIKGLIKTGIQTLACVYSLAHSKNNGKSFASLISSKQIGDERTDSLEEFYFLIQKAVTIYEGHSIKKGNFLKKEKSFFSEFFP